jgi:hypothetical protein
MAEKPQQQAKQEPKSPEVVTYDVYDMNAVVSERKHEVIAVRHPDGREPELKTYKLSADKPTPMPIDHAMQFLHDPAFKVVRPDGQVIQAPPSIERGTPLFDLPDNQTVAHLDELSRPALYKRCKMIPGAEKIGADAKVEVMIAFLVAERKRQKKVNAAPDELGTSGESDMLGGTVDPGTLAQMLPDSALLTQ